MLHALQMKRALILMTLDTLEAGRDSVVENIPELEWKGYAPFIHAATPIGRYNIDNFGIWLLRFNGKEIPLSTGSSLEEAKLAANEHYKLKIKLALGL